MPNFKLTLSYDGTRYRGWQKQGNTAQTAVSYTHLDVYKRQLTLTRDTKWVQDFKGNNLLLFGGEWNIAYTLKQNPGLELAEFSRN